MLITNCLNRLRISALFNNPASRKSYTKSVLKMPAALILLTVLIIAQTVYGQNGPAPDMSLHLAVLKGNVDAVAEHIKAGTDLNMKDQFGSAPLIIAATFGKAEAARLLIDAGADLNVTNNEGLTSLHIAALFCRTNIIKNLLDHGADRYIRNNSGATAFDIAAAPFEYDKEIYDRLVKFLGPLGLNIDYDKIKAARPAVAEMLRPGPEKLKSIDYRPVPGKGWEISTPVDEGLDPALVAQFYDDAAHLETIYGLLVIKNGRLVAEKYFNGGSIDQLSKRASVTKSYISALYGIALDKGYLKSVDEKMLDFFPEVNGSVTDPRKKEITVRQMLQMRGGYPWEETDSSYWNAVWSGRYIHYVEDIPLTKDPGTEFQYSNLTSDWLGIILSRACKTDLKSFADEYLFDPLDVKLGDWSRDMDGFYIGSGDIQFTARDMAKFGLLYLNKGKYDGKQLIPANWIGESLGNYSAGINSAGIKAGRLGRYFHDVGYGFQWWSAEAGSHRFNFAWGHGGQLIILLHDLNMVIVATADSFYGKEKHFTGWKFERSILNTAGKFIKYLPEKIAED